jgi:hypothetical protein
MFRLYQGERLSFLIIGVLAALMFAVTAQSTTVIVWKHFVGGFVFYGTVLTLGLALRVLGWLPRLSLTFVALGFYPIYSNILSLLIYSMFPLQRPLIDDTLFAIDAVLGYDWVQAVTLLSQFPIFAKFLTYVYLSTLFQLLILLLCLGMTGRAVQLHRMMLTGFSAGVGMFCFWIMWPSIGPSAYLNPSEEVMRAASLLVTPEYGALLMDVARNGVEEIVQHQMLGAIAFPSFHTVMACLAAVFARGTWLFWPYLVLNILMVPATLTHGGHHLIDLFGGAVLFVLAYLLARRIVPVGDVLMPARPLRLPKLVATA